MDSRWGVQVRPGGRRVGVLIAFATLIGSQGCIEPADVLRDDFASGRAQPLVNGQRVVQIGVGQPVTYQVAVPTGQRLDVEITPTSGGQVELLFVETPGGQVFSAAPNSPLQSQTGVYEVRTTTGAANGAGFRIIGAAGRSGSWRIGVIASRSSQFRSLGQAALRRSLLEQAVFLAYVLSGPHRNSDDPLDLLGALGRSVFPELPLIENPVAVVLRVRADDDDDSGQDPPDGNDNGSGNANDNSGGNDNAGGDDNKNDNDSGGNDNAGNDNGGANDNSNDNTSGNDNAGNDNSGNDNSGGGNDNDNDNSGDNTNDNSAPPTQVVLQRIVRSGDAVPGQPSATFTDFGNPILDGSGRVAFWAGYANGSGDGGLFVWEAGTLRRVVDDNPANAGGVPGRNVSAFFGNYTIAWDAGASPITWGTNGRLILVSPITGGTNSRGVYRWRASDADILRVADMEQVAALFPDTFQGAFAAEFFAPGLSDDGIVAFSARYTYITADRQFVAGKRGVFTSNGQTISFAADNRLSQPGDVPEQGLTVAFDDFDQRIAMNAPGDILFQASYLNGDGSRGLYRDRDGVLSRVLDNASNRAFPGLSAIERIGTVNAFHDAVALGDGGAVAVDTRVRISGQQRDAVLLLAGGAWRELNDATGAAATALVTGLNASAQTVYLAGGRPHLATAGGDIDLTATLPPELSGASLTWELGGAVNNRGRAILRFTRAGANGAPATPGVALWTGERLIVVFDPTLAAENSGFDTLFSGSTPENDRPGRSGMLSDRDELVFRVGDKGGDNQENTADDSQAIFLGKGQ